MACWTEEELFDVVLSGEVEEEGFVHLAECPHCVALYDRILEIREAFAGLVEFEPPREIVRRAVALRRRQGLFSRLVETVQAALVFEPVQLAAAGVRSGPGASGDDRFVRFEQGDRAVEVRAVERDRGEFDLTGRVSGAGEEAPFAVYAWMPEGEREFPQMSDDLGSFHFSGLPGGLYTLRVELDSEDLVLSPVLLGHARN